MGETWLHNDMEEIALYKNTQKVGYLKYYLFEGDMNSPKHIELVNIWIHPKMRGKNYGVELVRNLEKIALKEKVNSIYVFVTKDNQDFKDFLTRNEFKVDSQKELWHRLID